MPSSSPVLTAPEVFRAEASQDTLYPEASPPVPVITFPKAAAPATAALRRDGSPPAFMKAYLAEAGLKEGEQPSQQQSLEIMCKKNEEFKRRLTNMHARIRGEDQTPSGSSSNLQTIFFEGEPLPEPPLGI